MLQILISDTKITILIVTGVAYTKLVADLIYTLDCKGHKTGKGYRTQSLVTTLLVAGLPPSPLFFTKLWAIGTVSQDKPTTILIIFLWVSVLQLLLYVSVVYRITDPLESKKKNIVKKKYINITTTLILAAVYALAPELILCY